MCTAQALQRKGLGNKLPRTLRTLHRYWVHFLYNVFDEQLQYEQHRRESLGNKLPRTLHKQYATDCVVVQ